MMHHGYVIPNAQKTAAAQEAGVDLETRSPIGKLFPNAGSGTLSLEDIDRLDPQLKDPGTPDFDSTQPAGFTFYGQFIDHDVTLTAPRDGVDETINTLLPIGRFENLRTAALDLDSVFHRGPDVRDDMYDQSTFELIIPGNRPWDVPREGDGTAIIGDGRNDENKIIVQIHALFMHAYNALNKQLRAQGNNKATAYAMARIELAQIHQYIIVHDYLTRFVELDVWRRTLQNGTRFYGPMMDRLANELRLPNGSCIEAVVPSEFSIAAFRFGHSQVRAGYRMNDGDNSGAGLFVPGAGEDGDLNGGVAIPENLVFNPGRFTSDADPLPDTVARTRKIDRLLSEPLFTLRNPGIPAEPAPGTVNNPTSLSKRNLLRHRQVGLADAFSIADAIGLPASRRVPVDKLELNDFPTLQAQPPLWYYILQEAQVLHNGERLGPIGSTILCETFFGILEHQRSSFFNWTGRGKGWQPEPQFRTLAGLLNFGAQQFQRPAGR